MKLENRFPARAQISYASTKVDAVRALSTETINSKIPKMNKELLP
jgi:hypothetical protein